MSIQYRMVFILNTVEASIALFLVSRPNAHFNAGVTSHNEIDYLFERFKG